MSRYCEDCYVSIDDRNKKAKRCVFCANERKAQRRRDWQRAFQKTPEGKAYSKKMRSTDAARKKKNEYSRRPDQKEKHREWCRSEKAREYGRKHYRTEQGKYRAVKGGSRRRGFGYNMLNTYSPGMVGHHINDVDVVFIDSNVHRRCSGRLQEGEHRMRVLNVYGSVEHMVAGKIPDGQWQYKQIGGK